MSDYIPSQAQKEKITARILAAMWAALHRDKS